MPGVKKKIMRRGNPRPVERGEGEWPNGWCFSTTFRWDLMTHKLLKLHAAQREVTMSALVCDILNGWLSLATDYQQDYFRVQIPKGARHPDVPERFVGYLESLGFSPVVRMQDAAMPGAGYESVAIPAQRHDVPPPPDAPATVPGPAAHPVPETHDWKPGEPIIGRSEVPEIPISHQQGPRSGVGTFDPAEHAKNARSYGHGNAAQLASDGHNPAQTHPDDLLRNR